MYINKVLPWKTLITLRIIMYDTSDLKNLDPLFTINYGQKEFYIYSGIEDVFVGDKKLITYSNINPKNAVFHQWGIIIDSSRYEIDTTGSNVGIPFFPPTPFIPPVHR